MHILKFFLTLLESCERIPQNSKGLLEESNRRSCSPHLLEWILFPVRCFSGYDPRCWKKSSYHRSKLPCHRRRILLHSSFLSLQVDVQSLPQAASRIYCACRIGFDVLRSDRVLVQQSSTQQPCFDGAEATLVLGCLYILLSRSQVRM